MELLKISFHPGLGWEADNNPQGEFTVFPQK